MRDRISMHISLHTEAIRRANICSTQHTRVDLLALRRIRTHLYFRFLGCVECHRDVVVRTLVTLVAPLPDAIVERRIELRRIVQEQCLGYKALSTGH